MISNDFVIDLHRAKKHTLEQANELVGILTRVTVKHSTKVDELIKILESIDSSKRELTTEIETKITKEIEDWNGKIRKLGAMPKGLWCVDIDSGDGYFCWKFPENEINYWHDHHSGFASRISLAEKEKKENQRNLDIFL